MRCRSMTKTRSWACWQDDTVLILAATPIGNLHDASPRLRQVLEEARVIVAEDTRVTGSLLAALGLSTGASLVAANEHSESGQVGRILEQAEQGTVVLVSDAGMPLVSDPGFVLVREARRRGVPVSVVPGPSAGISALTVSGLATDRFVHEGFIPKKGREGYFRSLEREPRTMVFFESPNRLAASLAEMATVWGAEREACVVRELTKMFEEVAWGTLGELAERFGAPTKGEIVIVVAGHPGGAGDMEQALVEVRALLEQGLSPSAACAAVAKEFSIPKRELYQAHLATSA